MANEFHIRVIKLAKYEELRPAAYGVNSVQYKSTFLVKVYSFVMYSVRYGS